MAISESNILEKLDNVDKEKVSYFIRLLLNQSKYRKLKEELFLRRKEIQQGETLTHDNVWGTLNV